MLSHAESYHTIHLLVYMLISFIRTLPHCLFVSWK